MWPWSAIWPRQDKGVVIQTLRSGDAAAAASIHAENFAQAWGSAEFEALIADSSCIGHLARGHASPPRADGFILSRAAGDEAEILSIAVRRARQGRGVARSLLMHHLGALGPHGVRSLFLEVDENNGPALALYRRAGFQTVGERKSYYRRKDGSAANALVMRRDLG